MGWSGYGIYSGDGTQTRHYNFLKWAKIAYQDDDITEWLGDKTIVPDDKKLILKKNLGLVIKHLSTSKYWNENKAIEWQMLLALCLDNEIKPPRILLKKGIEATEYLMLDHASDFDVPSRRRRVLKNFIKRADEYRH